MARLDGKVAIISGGARGMGAATSRLFVEAGARVVIGDLLEAEGAALVKDLKQRGLLEDTLVTWGGEFGRTPFGQGDPAKPNGRDHFGRAYSWWLAGGGVKPGTTFGETDDFAWNITQNPVHVHDMQATIMHLCGINHEAHTFRYQGRQFRITDVHGHVMNGMLA